jgi:hypothetical protein
MKSRRVINDYYGNQGYVVKREVKTPVGYIDFMLYRNLGIRGRAEKILIEVKEHKDIKHAIGQVISYAKYHPDVTKKKVVYFTRSGQYKSIDWTFREGTDIEIDCVHSYLELDDIVQYMRVSKRDVEEDEEEEVYTCLLRDEFTKIQKQDAMWMPPW